jgi:cell wall-associated NlpC family hydrolase
MGIHYEGLRTFKREKLRLGKKSPEEGGTDCSGTVEWALNQVLGKKIPRLNANGQAKDSRITLPGDNSRGTLNFYDWNNDGVYDHVTINLGDGTEINPYGGKKNDMENPGPIIIKAIPQLKDGQSMINRRINWAELKK